MFVERCEICLLANVLKHGRDRVMMMELTGEEDKTSKYAPWWCRIQLSLVMLADRKSNQRSLVTAGRKWSCTDVLIVFVNEKSDTICKEVKLLPYLQTVQLKRSVLQLVLMLLPLVAVRRHCMLSCWLHISVFSQKSDTCLHDRMVLL